VISELRNNDVCQQSRCGESALDRSCRCGCLNDSITSGAGELRPHVADHLEALRHILELFGDVVAEVTQLTTAIGAALSARSMRSDLAHKMLRKRFPFRTRLLLGGR
jgi:hypothetical protein